jgi:hypothetical protein
MKFGPRSLQESDVVNHFLVNLSAIEPLCILPAGVEDDIYCSRMLRSFARKNSNTISFTEGDAYAEQYIMNFKFKVNYVLISVSPAVYTCSYGPTPQLQYPLSLAHCFLVSNFELTFFSEKYSTAFRRLNPRINFRSSTSIPFSSSCGDATRSPCCLVDLLIPQVLHKCQLHHRIMNCTPVTIPISCRLCG